MIIRNAGEKDFYAILDLIKEFSVFQKTPEKVTITVEQMVEDKGLFRCILALADNKIIGFATYFFAYHSWTGKVLHLDDLYVTDDYRKQGTGKKLLDEVIELARSEHCKNVRWMVSRWNLNAIEFYKKTGATIDEAELNCNLALEEI